MQTSEKIFLGRKGQETGRWAGTLPGLPGPWVPGTELGPTVSTKLGRFPKAPLFTGQFPEKVADLPAQGLQMILDLFQPQ